MYNNWCTIHSYCINRIICFL